MSQAGGEWHRTRGLEGWTTFGVPAIGLATNLGKGTNITRVSLLMLPECLSYYLEALLRLDKQLRRQRR